MDPTLMLGDGLHFFHGDKTLYWIGPRLDGYVMRAVYTDVGGQGLGFGELPEPEARVEYSVEASSKDTRLEVNTYVHPHPQEPLDYGSIARIHTATGQLVVFSAPGGNRPPPELLARLMNALRPVTEKDLKRLPHVWFNL